MLINNYKYKHQQKTNKNSLNNLHVLVFLQVHKSTIALKAFKSQIFKHEKSCLTKQKGKKKEMNQQSSVLGFFLTEMQPL